MKRNKEDIVDSVLEKSESQEDRESLEVSKSLNLVKFLNTQVEKSNAKDTLRAELIDDLRKDLQNKDEKLPALVKIRLLEVLEKSGNDFTLGVLASMRDASFIKAMTEKGKLDGSGDDKSYEINKDDMDKFKKLAKYMDMIDTTEGE